MPEPPPSSPASPVEAAPKRASAGDHSGGRWRFPRFFHWDEFGQALSPHTILVAWYALFVGVISGFVALGLLKLIYFLTGVFFHGKMSSAQWSPLGANLGLWVILIPVIGALPVGLMVYFWEPTLRGHGIPEAMEAVLVHKSLIRKRVPLLKALGTALAIGTGGPFGAEGPIIQTGGAIGSLVGQWFRVSVYDRRVLLAAGAGAGMAATFKAPLAGILVAIELIVFEFRARSFIPIALACAMADAIAVHYRGAQPMFPAPHFQLHSMQELWLFALLGLLCGLIGWAMTKTLFGLEGWFEKLPFKPVAIWGPVVGAVILGIIGYFVPDVFGTGYPTIRAILNGHLSAGHLLTISTAKFWALVITLASGTTGGVFAPSLVIGGGFGEAFALAWKHLFPTLAISAVGFYALCAAAAVFGSIARAPFTAVVFLFELGHDAQAVLPLIVCVMLADMLTRLVCEDSMMTGKLAKRGLNVVSQDFIAPQLELWSTQIHELLEPVPAPKGMRDLETVLKTEPYIQVPPDESVVKVAHALIKQRADYAVVLDTSDPPQPVGVVSIADILNLEDQMINVRDARLRSRA